MGQQEGWKDKPASTQAERERVVSEGRVTLDSSPAARWGKGIKIDNAGEPRRDG